MVNGANPVRHCVVTAGPTYEGLDRARRLTNFSTGRLGCELAAYLHGRGMEVTLLIGEQATWRGERVASSVKTFTTGQNLADAFQALSKNSQKRVDAVFHAAAVADFRFGKVWVKSGDGSLREATSGKFSTREGTLVAELVPTPKIIGSLREWFPEACVVGWKYEVDGEQADVIESAREQIVANRTNACVANGPAYGLGFGVVLANGTVVKYRAPADLYACLADLAARHGGS